MYVVTARAARNMAFQGLLKLDGEAPTPIAEFKGSELIGTKIGAPNSVHKEVYVLPMDSVSATKVSFHACCDPV